MSTLPMSALSTSALSTSALGTSSLQLSGLRASRRHDRLLENPAMPNRGEHEAEREADAVHQALPARRELSVPHRAVQPSAGPVRQMLQAALRVLRETRRVWRLPLA